MNGAEALLRTAEAAGIDICFANAGTTEMSLMSAFDRIEGIRPILCLFEGGCTGAADGYARMKERPAMALLHLGPGLANGIANLHNARRARTPIFTVIGEHATWHIEADAPLNMDIACLCKTFSGWQRTTVSAAAVVRDTAEAVAAACRGQISSLIVPCDHLWSECAYQPAALPHAPGEPVDGTKIEAAVKMLREGRRAAIVMNGSALRKRGLEAAARLRAACGCDLLAVTFPAYADRGAGLVPITKIPYFPDAATAALAPYGTVLFAGTEEPVAFFGYEGFGSRFLGMDVRKLRVDGYGQDAAAALDALADALGAPSRKEVGRILAPHHRPAVPSGTLTPEKACMTLAALQPENAIIVDEGLTAGFPYFPMAATCAPHSYINITGGAIGQGIPCATGAAVACPDRPVINLQADGSGMYTLQALWTQAREGSNVTTLICSNRSYNIVRVELARAGHTSPGPRSLSLTDLANPALDWAGLARGMGVPGTAVNTVEALAGEMMRAFEEPGPHLIEMIL